MTLGSLPARFEYKLQKGVFKKMKIVIDARVSHFGGAYSYIRALFKEIINLDNKNDYLIIYDNVHGKLGFEKCREIFYHSAVLGNG